MPDMASARHRRHTKAWHRAERTPWIAATARMVAVLQKTVAPKGISADSRTMPKSETSATPSKEPSRDRARGRNRCQRRRTARTAPGQHLLPIPTCLSLEPLAWLSRPFGSRRRQRGQLLLVAVIVVAPDRVELLRSSRQQLQNGRASCRERVCLYV